MREEPDATFEDDRRLLARMRRHAVRRGGALAMVAGHFKLVLNEREKTLRPLVPQTAGSSGKAVLPGRDMGRFALRTFQMAIRLLRSCTLRSSARAWILLLVDDHHPGFLPHDPHARPPNGVPVKDLRRRFYRSPEAIPPPYVEMLQKGGFSPLDALLQHHDPRRTAADILPPETVFFSEESLREQFKKTTRRELRHHTKIIEAMAGRRGTSAGALFRGPVEDHATPALMEMGRAACSGELVQLILEMVPRHVSDILFMLPGERTPVFDLAVDVARYVAGLRSGSPPVVHMVSGMGAQRPPSAGEEPRLMEATPCAGLPSRGSRSALRRES